MKNDKLFVTIVAVLLVAMLSLAGGTPVGSAQASPALWAQGTTGASAEPNVPVNTTFSYQGRLTSGGNPANGNYDFQFRLFDAATGGNQVAININANVGVTNGIFTTVLDFGNAMFNGQALWLELSVRPASTGNYVTLSPRQAITAAPYALGLRPGTHVTDTSLEPAFSANNTDGGPGVRGDSHGGAGVHGTGYLGSGVFGASSFSNGVHGIANDSAGSGVYGNHSGAGAGVRGNSGNGFGVHGTGATGVYGSGTTRGVWGFSQGGLGVRGESPDGYGVRADSTTGHAVFAVTTSGNGVHASTSSGNGVFAGSGTGIGVVGQHTADTGTGPGVQGESNSQSIDAVGVLGRINSTSPAIGSAGVRAANNGTNSNGYGIYASHAGGGLGVYASTVNGTGVYGLASSNTAVNYGVYGQTNSATNGHAGYFQGRVHVNGTLSKAAGSFKIDHPQDPANKYLSHSFVESPDMKNIYDGVVVLDANGEATVRMPNWFDALNKEFRYQLTCVGGYAPVYVSQEMQGNSFKIAGGKAGLKVSWQVTGIRHDPYAEQHRIPVEEDKTASEKGKYLHPELYGKPDTSRLNKVEQK